MSNVCWNKTAQKLTSVSILPTNPCIWRYLTVTPPNISSFQFSLGKTGRFFSTVKSWKNQKLPPPTSQLVLHAPNTFPWSMVITSNWSQAAQLSGLRKNEQRTQTWELVEIVRVVEQASDRHSLTGTSLPPSFGKHHSWLAFHFPPFKLPRKSRKALS